MQMDKSIIIEKIKNNKRIINNEDLIDNVLSLVQNRVEGVIEDIKDNVASNTYLEKFVTKSIIDTLRAEGRYSLKAVTPIQKINYRNFDYDVSKYKLSLTPISKLKQLYSMLQKSDEKNNTSYKDFLEYRYKNKLSTTEIAKELQLNEQNIVDILFEMSEYSDKVARV